VAIDLDEAAEYEAWKERKLNGSLDLSYAAYNAEMSTAAVAWDEGFEACNSREGGFHSPHEDENPYRKAGMRGHVARPVEPPT
jgi:hypothetical protein